MIMNTCVEPGALTHSLYLPEPPAGKVAGNTTSFNAKSENRKYIH